MMQSMGVYINQIDVFDVSTKKMLTSKEGYTTFPAFATRTGVLKYRNRDGSIVRQLRPEEEVFNADSLRTLSNKPVTNSHPSKLIDTKNTRDHMVGSTGSEIVRDGDKVGVTLTLMDAKTIDDVMKKGKVELSCGYRCEHDNTPGVFDGEPYDLVQRNISYNHLAIVDRGRAGSKIKIHTDDNDFEINLDSEDGIVLSNDALSNNDIERQLRILLKEKISNNDFIFVIDVIGNQVIYEIKDKTLSRTFNQENDIITLNQDEIEVVKVTSFKKVDQVDLNVEKVDNKHDPEEDQRRKKKLKEVEKMKKITINGIDQDVSDEFKKVYDSTQKQQKPDDKNESDIAKKDEEISKLQAERDSYKQKLDAENEGDKKAKLDAEINEKVKSRVNLYKVTDSFLSDEVKEKLDSMSDIDIKKAAIKSTLKDDSTINLDEKDDNYINARFDILLDEGHDKKHSNQDAVLGKKIADGMMLKDSDQNQKDPKMEAWKNPSPMMKIHLMAKGAN